MSRTVAFYVDVLGCGIESELPEYGMVQLRAGRALIDLVDVDLSEGRWARPEVAGGRNLDHVCIAIDMKVNCVVIWRPTASRSLKRASTVARAGTASRSTSETHPETRSS
jgi:hypothetical protein